MTRGQTLVRTAAAAALALAGAGLARAQERSDEGSRRSGPLFGVEAFADERELVVDKYKETGFFANTPPFPPGYSSWDEEVLEHRIQYSARHFGIRATVQWLNDGPVATRIGAWIGPVWAEIAEHVQIGDYVYGSTERGRGSLESKIGFGGGIIAEARGAIPGGPLFWGLGLDSTIGQVALDNGILANQAVDGEYLFMIGTVHARLGFTPRGASASPYVGAAFTYYYGDADMESILGSNFLTSDATFSDRAYIRIIAGFEIGKPGGDCFGRLFFGIWKPGEDTIVNVGALVRIG
ncbi:MAG: hypothetical protein L0216_15600 [Planctomycetales bacterium]|nr:hypothetical protein [Planctomycetales bacterium]